MRNSIKYLKRSNIFKSNTLKLNIFKILYPTFVQDLAFFSMKISTYVINLVNRIDRRLHILEQFEGRHEFDLHIVEAETHEIGAVGLWNTITKILLMIEDADNDFILICEDDHQFTDFYSKEALFTSIEWGRLNQADILLGGVSSIKSVFTVSQSMLWVEGFSGLQFTIIYKKFYKTILDAYFQPSNAADYLISSLSQNKFVIYPFISLQREFGYSDVTYRNNEIGLVSSLFNITTAAIQYIKDVELFHSSANLRSRELNQITDFEDISIPTFVVNLSKRTDRLSHIKRQFKGRAEFDVEIIDLEEHKIRAFGLWKTIRKIVQSAAENDEDVILICEDGHMFTRCYNRDHFLRNVLEAYIQGVDILSGGITGGFSHAIVASNSRFWINHFSSTQFIVIYKKLFQKIIDKPFNESVTTDDCLSELTSNKMVLYPFVSIQKYFGYSDAAFVNNSNSLAKSFKDCNNRLMLIKEAHDIFFSKNR